MHIYAPRTRRALLCALRSQARQMLEPDGPPEKRGWDLSPAIVSSCAERGGADMRLYAPALSAALSGAPTLTLVPQVPPLNFSPPPSTPNIHLAHSRSHLINSSHSLPPTTPTTHCPTQHTPHPPHTPPRTHAVPAFTPHLTIPLPPLCPSSPSLQPSSPAPTAVLILILNACI
ncbi:hypothetical protein HYPSUDRAFT_197019 [Hypholoma sublateritium FD-334 SS-4]|uniref:Uncharacterized protein n=1 Tax=Hypholoma sublateritium (strain FD-334 SS-4) TaxID=945553 RepID=A0A0D2PKE1_HYPSF|nr:hypothetical protein HYPSUDRAFT_197019 [Hypholoma sublateritium FD-334 SS-4]